MRTRGIACRAALSIFLAGAALLPLPAAAQAPPDSDAAPPVPQAEILVVGTTPLPGIGLDADKLPGMTRSLSSEDLSRAGPASIVKTLQDQVSGVNVNGTLGDGFQPDILYHGFEASPVLGTPQGLAVYQGGVRINEAFGDTVNWDLVPDIAVDRIDLVGSNPVYGLNALGGAVAITMKNGFTYQGNETDLAGGSFGRREASFQSGQRVDNVAAYIAGTDLDEDGWRRFSPNSLRQLYADLAARNERATIDISFTGANNRLFGSGVTPVQELAVDRTLTFTGPQHDFNQLAFVTANGTYQASDSLSLQGDLFRREFRQTTVNGNTTNYVACTPANGFLCQPDGTTIVTAAISSPVPDLSYGGTQRIGENDRESIRAVSLGAALQATHSAALLNHDNNLVAGASVDHANVDFQSTAEIGPIDSSLTVVPSGFFVETPQNAGFNATPVGLSATMNYYGIFATDTFDVTPALSVTASGRYNLAQIALIDRIGTQLTGNSQYRRFNPALGASYKLASGLTAYAGYSEANRAPTPSEIECSNPAQPCLLPSSLSSDPPTLKQVVSHTYEAGLRGNFALPAVAPGAFTWNLGFYRTDLDDDIYGVATSISAGFFENIGATRRQGLDAGIAYKDERWSAQLGYSIVDATFQAPLTLPSPNNPAADAQGNIHVQAGDHLPGIPEHRVTLNGDYHLSPSWIVGATVTYTGAQFYRGDEANQNAPLPGYTLVNLHSSYQLTPQIELFASVDNLFDARYSTFGQFGDPTGIGTPGIAASATTSSPGVDNRFQSPGAPIAAFAGIRARF